jgi:hypothetical protein
MDKASFHRSNIVKEKLDEMAREEFRNFLVAFLFS